LEHAIVEIYDAVADAAPRELLRPLASTVREMHPETGVEQDLGHGISEGLIVAGWHEKPRFAVLDDGLQSTDAGPDDGRAARHRFERDQPERFGQRRHRAQIRGRVVQGEILLPTRTHERHIRFEAVLVDEAAELEDLLRFGRIVARIEGAADHEKTDVASHFGVTLKEKAER